MRFIILLLIIFIIWSASVSSDSIHTKKKQEESSNNNPTVVIDITSSNPPTPDEVLSSQNNINGLGDLLNGESDESKSSTYSEIEREEVVLDMGIQTNNADSENKEEPKVQATSSIEMSASHVLDETESQKLNQTVKVPPSYLKYRLTPKVIGRSRLLILDAQDNDFYLKRMLKKPILTLWILTKQTNKLTYGSKRLFEEAWRMNIQVMFVETTKLDMIVTQDGLEHILYKGVKVKLPDCVYPRLGASIDYYGMALIRQLEKNGVLILNPTLSIEISRDKLYSLQHLASHNLPIPKTMFTKLEPLTDATITGIEREFNYPIVLKKSHGSQGKGVILAENRNILKDIMDMLDTSQPLIFQEYISNSKGRDIRVFIVGGKAIGAMMRVANKGFKSNFHQGGYVKRVKLSPVVEWLAIEAARLIGLDIAGVDILIDKDTYRICEVNASPGFEGFELATGINVPKKMLEFVSLRVGVWKKNRKSDKKKRNILVPIEAEHILKPTRESSDKDAKSD